VFKKGMIRLLCIPC